MKVLNTAEKTTAPQREDMRMAEKGAILTLNCSLILERVIEVSHLTCQEG
jgi:hypothetical protein